MPISRTSRKGTFAEVQDDLGKLLAPVLKTSACRSNIPENSGHCDVCVQESNDLITEGVEGSQKLVWMANRSLRVLPLPVLAAMNGHTAFVQELHLR